METSRNEGRSMEAGIGKIVHMGSLELRFLVDETSSNNLVMFEFIVPPNARVPARHFHKSVDEAIYALERVTTTTLDEQKHELSAGQSLLGPRGFVLIHENLSDEVARSLIVLSPGTIGRRYFEEMAVEINGPGKPDPAKIKEIMLRHGLVPA